MSDEDWITTAEASQVSGYSEQYIRSLIRSGKLMARKFGIVWQVSHMALLAYLKEAESSSDQRRGPREN